MNATSSTGFQFKPAALTILICLLVGSGIFFLHQVNASALGAQPAAASCVPITDARQIPGPKIITFDDLTDKTALSTQYKTSYGVEFLNQAPPPVIHAVAANDSDTPQTPPNVAQNPLVAGTIKTPFVINFTFPRTHVGFFLGNGGLLLTGKPVSALITALDAAGGTLCSFVVDNIPTAHTLFAGVYDSSGSIASVSIDYGGTVAESIDNLYLAPGANYGARKPLPRWTPIPSAVPTQGPTPTATPAVPLYAVSAYHPPLTVIPSLYHPDFGIFNIEISQGIQCFNGLPASGPPCADNSLSFVLNKSTVIRVYLQARDSHSFYNNVPVRLHLLAFGNEYVMDATGNATASIDQSRHDAAEFYFTAYSGSTATVQVWAEVDPGHLYAASYLHNRFPAAGTNSYSFANRQTMLVVGERLYYHPSGYTLTQYAGGWAVNGGAAQWWNLILPVGDNGINYLVRSGYLDWTSSLSSADAQHSLISALNLMWIKENALSWWFGTGPFTGASHVYGWAPAQGYSGGHADMPVYPHAGGLGVVGIGSDAAGTSLDNPGSGALIFAHELTHDYNVFHTNTPDACGSNDSNTNFPYPNSSIQSFGFNPITGNIYNPSLTQDLMSYCPSGGSKQGWISPFTWGQMFTDLHLAPSTLAPGSQSTAAAAPAAASQPQVVYTQSLVVNVVIDHPATATPLTVYTGHLGALLRVNSTGAYTALPGGAFTVEEHDAPGGLGKVLAFQSFSADFASEYAPPPGGVPAVFPSNDTPVENISFIMPWADGTRSIVLVYRGAVLEVLDQRDVSLNAPQVKITSPVQAVNWLAHTTPVLKWTGNDLDGDPLTYSVLYSYDGGLSYLLLADNLTATSYPVNVDSMAGGSDVRFRVVASDGVNTGFDETPATITIPNQAPVALITDPSGASIHQPGDLIVFHGIGTDMEDGTLPAAAMVWSDNLQGGLGIGQTVPINTLTPGTHTITLTVTDSYGVSTTATVTIQVAYPMYLTNMRR